MIDLLFPNSYIALLKCPSTALLQAFLVYFYMHSTFHQFPLQQQARNHIARVQENDPPISGRERDVISLDVPFFGTSQYTLEILYGNPLPSSPGFELGSLFLLFLNVYE